MRKYVFFVLFLVPFVLFGQENGIKFKEIVKVDSTLTQKQLYNNARKWFSKTFFDSKDVLQMDDKESGDIIEKSAMDFKCNIFGRSKEVEGFIDYIVSVKVKDGKYLYEISGFFHRPKLPKEINIKFNSNGIMENYEHGISLGFITTDEECQIKIMGKGERIKVWGDLKKTIDGNIPGLIASLQDAMVKKADTSW